MLTNAILITLASVLNAVIGILPLAQSLPNEIDTAISFIANQMGQWSSFFPFVGTFFTVLLLVITIEGFIFLYGGVNWTLNKVRGSG